MLVVSAESENHVGAKSLAAWLLTCLKSLEGRVTGSDSDAVARAGCIHLDGEWRIWDAPIWTHSDQLRAGDGGIPPGLTGMILRDACQHATGETYESSGPMNFEREEALTFS